MSFKNKILTQMPKLGTKSRLPIGAIVPKSKIGKTTEYVDKEYLNELLSRRESLTPNELAILKNVSEKAEQGKLQYGTEIQQSNLGQILRNYLNTILLDDSINSCFSLNTDNTCCTINPELRESVRLYESKVTAGEMLSIGEIPLLFVVKNKTGHSSVIIVSGTIDKGVEGGITNQKVYSIGLLLTGEAGLGSTDKIAEGRGYVLTSGVRLVSPDPTITPFASTKSGKPYEYTIEEMLILSTPILDNIQMEFNKGTRMGGITRELRPGYKGVVSSVTIDTGEPYKLLSYPCGLGGRNCAQFIISLAPEHLGSSFLLGWLAHPDNITSKRRSKLTEAQIKYLLSLLIKASPTPQDIVQFIGSINGTRPFPQSIRGGKIKRKHLSNRKTQRKNRKPRRQKKTLKRR
jgi:hypothetical protein